MHRLLRDYDVSKNTAKNYYSLHEIYKQTNSDIRPSVSLEWKIDKSSTLSGRRQNPPTLVADFFYP